MRPLSALLLLLFATFVWASDDNAAPKRKRPQKQATSERNGEMTACASGRSREDVECAHKMLQLTESSLKTHYDALLKKIDEEVRRDPERLVELKPRLIAAQDSWVKYRESQCQAVAVWYTNGTLQAALYANCMREHGERRIKELDHFADYGT